MFTLFHHHQQDELASSRDRERWADNISGLLRDLDRPVDRFSSRRFGPIYRPEVVGPCAPALRQVRDILGDPDAVVTRGDLHRLEMFVCEGVGLALARPESHRPARRAAVELLAVFTAAASRRRAPAAA